MKNLSLTIVAIILGCFLIYKMYWLFKTGSYFFFYEDMVQETIRELVQPEYLK